MHSEDFCQQCSAHASLQTVDRLTHGRFEKENPQGKMPLIKDSDKYVSGLDSIVSYLEDKYSEPSVGKLSKGKSPSTLPETCDISYIQFHLIWASVMPEAWRSDLKHFLWQISPPVGMLCF